MYTFPPSSYGSSAPPQELRLLQQPPKRVRDGVDVLGVREEAAILLLVHVRRLQRSLAGAPNDNWFRN